MADEQTSTKSCRTCKQEKNRLAFHRDAAKADGLTSSCKECAKARAKSWYRANVERAKIARSVWYQANKVACSAKMAAYRRLHSHRIKAAKRAWYMANVGKKRAYDIQWQAANRRKFLTYRIVSEQRRRAATKGGATAQDVREILARQQYRCAICRVSIKKRRHIDHIKPLALGGSNERTNLQGLCPTCNERKSWRDPLAHMQSLGFLL